MSSLNNRVKSMTVVEDTLEDIILLAADIRLSCGLIAGLSRRETLAFLELADGDRLALISDLQAAKRLLSACKRWAKGTSEE